MSGGEKLAKRARKLPEICLAPHHASSEAGPSGRNVSWTTTIKRNEDKGRVTITESKHTREDSTPDPALQPGLQVEDVSVIEPPSGSFEPSVGGNSEPLPQSETKQKRKRKCENTAKVCDFYHEKNLSNYLLV